MKANGEWQEIKWDFSDFRGNRSLTLKIVVHPGRGSLFFDDFVLEPM